MIVGANMPKKPKFKIDPNELKTRDPLIVKLITGATKSGVQADQKKQASKKACRKKIDQNED